MVEGEPVPPPRTERPTASAEARRATRGFLAARGKHSEEEDLHPTRLDPPAAELERALGRKPAAEREDERDA